MCIKNWFKNLFNPVNRLSKDDRIREALKLLDKIVIERLQDKSYDIKWDSSLPSNVYACRAEDFLGNNFILVNYLWYWAPVEEVACLVAHESCHVKRVADISEEVEATMTEAMTWRTLKVPNKKYTESLLFKRLERLASMCTSEIVEEISKSNFYEEVLKVG